MIRSKKTPAWCWHTLPGVAILEQWIQHSETCNPRRASPG